MNDPTPERDLPLHNPHALVGLAVEAARAGQLGRAETAARALLDHRPHDVAGLYAFGIALAPTRPFEAAFLLGAAGGTTASNSGPKLPDVPERLARLTLSGGGEGEVEAIVGWIGRWYPDHTGLIHAGIVALDGRLPRLAGLFDFLEGYRSGDKKQMKRGALALPDVPAATLAWTRRITDRGLADAERRKLIERLTSGWSPDPLSAQIQRALSPEPDEPPLVAAWVARAVAASDRRAWEEAMAFADQVLALAPMQPQALMAHAYGATFSGRYEVAVDDYARAIAAISRLVDEEGATFDDERAQLWLNRACCNARLGQLEDCLDDLRRAVTADPSFADKIYEDDWLEPVWDDPRLAGIVARDPAALVTRGEREPGSIAQILQRASEAADHGEYREAAGLAGRAAAAAAAHPELRAQALSQQVQCLALVGRLDEAREIASETKALLATGVCAEVAGEAWARICLLHQVEGDLRAAEEACERGLAANIEAHGPRHPAVAQSWLIRGGIALDRGQSAPCVASTREAIQMLIPLTGGEAGLAAWSMLVAAQNLQAAAFELVGDTREAIAAVSAGLDTLLRLAERGVALPAPVVGELRVKVDRLSDAPGGGGLVEKLAALDGDDPAPRVHRVFRGVRQAVAGWRAAGAPDDAIGRWIRDLVLQHEVPPALHEALPGLAALVGEVAEPETAAEVRLVAAQLSFTDLDLGLRGLEILLGG